MTFKESEIGEVFSAADFSENANRAFCKIVIKNR